MNYSPTLYAKIRTYLLTSTDSRLHDYENKSSGAVPNFWMCTFSQAPENHYDEVYPGIFMGDYTLVQDKRALRELGISHIVNCSQGTGSGETNTDARFYRDVGIKYHGMKALDLPTYNMMPHFKAASDFIEKALKKDGRIFIHCYKGVSRSATIVIAYLMMKCNTDLEDAVKMIRAKRKIHPNDGFIRQLCILSRQLYGAKFE